MKGWKDKRGSPRLHLRARSTLEKRGCDTLVSSVGLTTLPILNRTTGRIYESWPRDRSGTGKKKIARKEFTLCMASSNPPAVATTTLAARTLSSLSLFLSGSPLPPMFTAEPVRVSTGKSTSSRSRSA